MSTKRTIVRGADFHFYNECDDDEYVHLELNISEIKAGFGQVTVAIPIHIWETIRHLGGVPLDLVDQEDEDLRATVENAVDQRIARYQQALQEFPDHAGLIGLIGGLFFGVAGAPRHEQIRMGMEYFQAERERQREVKLRFHRLRKAYAEMVDSNSQQAAPLGR